MKKALLSLLLFCSIPAFSQIQTTVEKTCYLLYGFNGKEFTKNKKIKEGTPIILVEESNSFPNFYIVKYKDDLYSIKKDFINQVDLASYIKAKEDSLLKIRQKEEAIIRYNDSTKMAKRKRVNDSIAIIKHRADSIIKHQKDSIKTEKKIIALAVFQAYEDRKNELINLGMPIEIAYLTISRPNSAGGVDLMFKLKNISKKRIKYISVTGYVINAVDDKCVCTVRRYSQCTRKGVGPIEPDEYASYSWENTWYNHTIDRYIPMSINIQYMDGTSITISGNKIKKIMQNELLDDVFKRILKEKNININEVFD